MGSPIAQRQNEKRSLQCLAAMRVLYAQAKRIRTIRVSITVIIAVCGLALGRITTAQQYLALLAWWTILDQVIGAALEERFVHQAASVQEEFDTYVLDIPWNPRISRLPPEEILAAEARFRGNRKALEDWYGKYIPSDFGTLICMRSNMAWDYILRRTYGWVLVSVSAVWVFLVVVVSLLTGSTVGDLLVTLAPSLPLVAQNANMAKVHFGVAEAKKQIENELRRTWCSATDGHSAASEYSFRGLQDGIHALREANALVPDVVYSYLRRRYNDIMIRATQHFDAEVAASASPDSGH